MGLRDEIGQQSAIAARLLETREVDLAPLLDAIRKAGVLNHVLIAARGTSDHAATYAQYAIGYAARLPVALATPSLLTRYRIAPRLHGALVIGISQSGRSPDIVEVIADARSQGQVTAAITSDPESPLAGAAEHVLPLRTGPEASVAATKTYGAQLLTVAMLAAALADDERHAADLARVPDVLDEALSLEAEAAAAAEAHGSMQEAIVLGRGFNLATALEWALKLKELAYVRAQGYSTADFQHGPTASLAPGGRLLAVSAHGPMEEELTRVLDELKRSRKAIVLRVAGAAEPASGLIRFPDSLPEWLSPLAAIVPIQLFCFHLARAKGIDFESPRGLQKVTLTR